MAPKVHPNGPPETLDGDVDPLGPELPPAELQQSEDGAQASSDDPPGDPDDKG